MSADIHVIPSAPEGISVVALLEEMLERAKAGEFSSICIAYVDRDGVTGSGWSKVHSRATLVGALAWAQRDLLE